MSRLLSRFSDMISVALKGRVASPPVEGASTDALLGEVAASVASETRDYDGDSRKPVIAPIAARRAEESWARLEPLPAPLPVPAPSAAGARSGSKAGSRTEPVAEDKGWDILGGV